MRHQSRGLFPLPSKGHFKAGLAAAGLTLGLLSGCESDPLSTAAGAVAWFPTPLIAADLASLAVTDKTLVDNGYSLVSGKDCSTVRYLDGDYYCREKLPDNQVVDTRLYCYRTLGKITCYDQPQPYQRNQQVAPSLVKAGSRTQRLEN